MNRVIVLGLFDSFHLGHRRLISVGEKIAFDRSAVLSVATFSDDVYSVLGLDDKCLYLSEEKELLIQEKEFSKNVKEIILFSDLKKFLNLSPIEFLDYLTSYEPIAIVVGADYTFGKGAKGTVADLTEYFSTKNVDVIVCDLVTDNGEKISTSRIKKLIADGKIVEANALLADPFFVYGEVIDGCKNGKKLGFPTANIAIDEYKFAPKAGVYMTKTYVDGSCYLSVTNVGTHPTVNTEKANFETFIIDFNNDIYKKTIKIEFYNYIRGVKKFDNVSELIAQITEDINYTQRTMKI